jgi:putative hemolysin
MEEPVILKSCFAWLCLSLVLAACTPTATPVSNMPNPASVYCEQNGGTLEIRPDTAGNQSGVCLFPDGSECDEWAYFRGECAPAHSTPEPTVDTANGWKVYRNEVMGFSFQYPADAAIMLDDNGYTVYVNGPVVDNNSWPVFMISYPSDRADYRVPADVGLQQWLIDHNLYVDEPQPDVIIAGTTAVHTRFPRGQQAFANDRFYFVHNGQMFVITILHTGDKEDWELYNLFLQSFAFD